MTIFGMPPDDPSGLRPGADEALGRGGQSESIAESENHRVEMLEEYEDDSSAEETARGSSPSLEDEAGDNVVGP